MWQLPLEGLPKRIIFAVIRVSELKLQLVSFYGYRLKRRPM